MKTASILIVAALVLVVFLVWMTRVSGRPERTAGHDDRRDEARPDTTSDRFYRGVDRPAGPDAEDTPAPGAGVRWEGTPPPEEDAGH